MSVTPGQTALASDIINGVGVYAADAGSTDAYAISLPTSPGSYVTGAKFVFKANTANTGAATLDVNSLGAKTIKKNYNTDLVTGDILANQFVHVVYDGTNFQMISPVSLSMTCKTISSTHSLANTGAETIAHGLPAIPKLVKITATVQAQTAPVNNLSIGSYDGTTQSCNVMYQVNASSTNGIRGQDTTHIIYIYGQPDDSVNASAIITVDATNITLTWSKTGSPTGTVAMTIEAIT